MDFLEFGKSLLDALPEKLPRKQRLRIIAGIVALVVVGSFAMIFLEKGESSGKGNQTATTSGNNSPVLQSAGAGQALQNNNYGQSSILNSPNSINTIGQIGGTNVIVNNGPIPYIAQVISQSLNVADGKSFRSDYWVWLANSSDPTNIIYRRRENVEVIKTSIIHADNFTMSSDNGMASGTSFIIAVYTTQKIQKDDVKFEVKPH